MNHACLFSPDRRFRYTLWRNLPGILNKGTIQFVGLNPSTADERLDDPTIRRCRNFAAGWGYSRMCMTNLCAFRATNPLKMKRFLELADLHKLNRENFSHVMRVASQSTKVVACWGNQGTWFDLAKDFLAATLSLCPTTADNYYMDNNVEHAQADVQIDELNLDKECVRLPSLYLRYAHLAADKKRDMDEMKNELEVIEADLSKEVREHPAKFGLEKETEKAIAAVVFTHERYQKAVRRMSRARHELDLIQGVVSALEHKKRSLTLLVELHGMAYSAGVKPSREGREAVERMKQRRGTYRREDSE